MIESPVLDLKLERCRILSLLEGEVGLVGPEYITCRFLVEYSGGEADILEFVRSIWARRFLTTEF
jgi:hypothetical protein